jgi:hypothetical protein
VKEGIPPIKDKKKNRVGYGFAKKTLPSPLHQLVIYHMSLNRIIVKGTIATQGF